MTSIKVHGKIIDTIRELIGEDDDLRDLRIKCKRAENSKVWFGFEGLSSEDAIRLLGNHPNVDFYEEKSIALSSSEEITEGLFDHIRDANNPRCGVPFHVENLKSCDIYHYYYYDTRVLKIESKDSTPTKYYSLDSEFLNFWGWH